MGIMIRHDEEQAHRRNAGVSMTPIGRERLI